MVLHQLKEGPLPVEKPTCGQWASMGRGLYYPGLASTWHEVSNNRLLNHLLGCYYILRTDWILNLVLEGLETLRLY
jgi:hypothetical protein